YGRKNEYNLSISRGELNQFLLQEAEDQGVRFFFNHELEGLDPKNKTLSFNSSGSKKTASYDLLFATDGSGSRVRKELHRLKPNLFEDHTEWLEADYKELTMPLFNGKAPMDRQALHIWPRGAHMMMGLANRDGSFTM